jgi:UDP-glucose 4-epimerase
MAQLLITGGAGFIGSHTCLVLLEAGHNLVVLDDFSNSNPESLRRVLELANLPPGDGRLEVVEGDIRSGADLTRAFSTAAEPIEGVVHFAGLKAVGESVQDPLRYWDVNVAGSRCLLAEMQRQGCRVIVFSSTSTVYGQPERFPLLETDPVAPLHPYAQTKLAVEQLLEALAGSEPSWRISILRYFNPVGAHPSGRIGEDPRVIPNNLFPFITQVAAGRQEELRIFGNDYPTPDGTGIRDYLHVMDLAEAHALALERLLAGNASLPTLNVGTGRGLSVLEVVVAFETATGLSIPRVVLPRRPGDVPCLQASPELAGEVLGWRARRTLAEMCRDGWAWQQANPQGYGKG